MFGVVVFLTLVSFSLCEFDPELHAKHLSMPPHEFVEHFNKQNYSFKIGSAPNIDSSHFPCVHIDKESYKKLPKVYHGPEVIAAAPSSFDARQQWPSCQSINEIHNQGQCGSCWAFGTATVASDRTCIHTGVNVNLAEQDFECLDSNVCKGHDPHKSFQFWISNGLVTQECKPYDVSRLQPQARCTRQCVNGADYNGDKHYGESFYSVSNDEGQIMAELSQNGPIEAVLMVYMDFRYYRSGVYEYISGERVGYHSVRLIGYGEEGGIPYWLGANSWGTGWGEYGFFKIKRYAPYLELENYLLTGKPKK